MTRIRADPWKSAWFVSSVFSFQTKPSAIPMQPPCANGAKKTITTNSKLTQNELRLREFVSVRGSSVLTIHPAPDIYRNITINIRRDDRKTGQPFEHHRAWQPQLRKKRKSLAAPNAAAIHLEIGARCPCRQVPLGAGQRTTRRLRSASKLLAVDNDAAVKMAIDRSELYHIEMFQKQATWIKSREKIFLDRIYRMDRIRTANIFSLM